MEIGLIAVGVVIGAAVGFFIGKGLGKVSAVQAEVKKRTELDAIQWAKDVVALGAGEILLTSIDRDGTGLGYDIELTRTIANNVKVPVIASGGASTPDHFYAVLTGGSADAALAAGMFHYGKYTVMDVKNSLIAKGVVVRK